jgi:hypothetical protein
MGAPPQPPKPGSPEATLKTKLKRYHRKEKQPAPPKKKPKKAILPNGKYFHKVAWVSLKKLAKADKREGRKKLRGAKKKEAARVYKLMFPKGEPMACKKGPDYFSIIYPGVICKMRDMNPRAASRYLTKIRKKLGKPRGEIITLKEFCKATPFTEEEVIPYLKF